MAGGPEGLAGGEGNDMRLRALMALVPLSLAVVLMGAAPAAVAQDTGWIR